MKIAKRERHLLMLAAGVIVSILLFELMIRPFFAEKKRLDKGVVTKRVELEELTRKSAEYQALRTNEQDIRTRLSKRQQTVTLFAFLEQEAEKGGIKGKIEYMKPSVSDGEGPYKESLVEMKLQGVTLKQLTGYLYRIESPEQIIGVKRISIKEDKKESGYLDVILQVLTLEEKAA
jgi:general secretion pathway protein M